MSKKLTFIFLTQFLAFVNCDDPRQAEPLIIGDCQIDDVSDLDWETGVNLNIIDTDRAGTRILSKKYSNITDIYFTELLPCEDHKTDYLTVTLDGEYFNVVLFNTFNEYEDRETSLVITKDVTFLCSSGVRRLTLKVNVRDTNNHAPKFLPNNVYEYRVQLPVPQGFPVSVVYGDVLVQDVDLTNYEIVPMIVTNDYFDVQYKEVDSTLKLYTLVLIAKTRIETIEEPIELVIFATDKDKTGFPNLTSLATATVRGIRPSLNFEHPSYKAFYNLANGVIIIKQDIKFVEKLESNVSIKLEGDKSELFTTNFDEGQISINPSGVNVESMKSQILIFTLTATNNHRVAETVIIIEVVES